MALSAGIKNTLYSVLAAVTVSALGAMWVGVGKAQAGFAQLTINTQAIENIGRAMELRGIDRVIESKSKEIRDKQIGILNAANNQPLRQLLDSQVSKLQQEIAMQKVIRECVVDPDKKVCR